MSVTTNLKRAAQFVVLAYILSYGLIYSYFALGGKWASPLALPMMLAYMLMPMVSAIILQKLVCKEGVIGPLGVSFKLNKWFLVAWFLMPVVVIATIGVSLLMPGIHYDPNMTAFFERFRSSLTTTQMAQMKHQIEMLPAPLFVLIGLIQGLIAGVTINAVFAFGEELGWRGFLQKQLGFLGFWRSSVVIGIVWGFWHAPVILQGYNYPQHPVLGVFMMTAWTVLLAPIFSYVRLRSKSVIAASILHGTLNGCAGAAVMVIRGGGDLIVGLTGLMGFIILALVNIGIFVYDRYYAEEQLIVA